MTTQTTQLRAALALTELVTHPHLRALSWTVSPEGVLSGYAITDSGTGSVVDIAADLMGTPGFVERKAFRADSGELRGVAELTTTWREVLVYVRASYPLALPEPEPVGDSSWPAVQLAAELRDEPQVQSVTVEHQTGLSVVVVPETLADWERWRTRLGGLTETVRGDTATVSGESECGVDVRLTGVGAGRLASAVALSGGVR